MVHAVRDARAVQAASCWTLSSRRGTTLRTTLARSLCRSWTASSTCTPGQRPRRQQRPTTQEGDWAGGSGAPAGCIQYLRSACLAAAMAPGPSAFYRTGCHTTFLAAAVSLPGTPEPAPVPRPCAAPCVSFRGIVHRDLKLENLLLVEPHDITHIKIAGGCQQRSRVWCWCRVVGR